MQIGVVTDPEFLLTRDEKIGWETWNGREQQGEQKEEGGINAVKCHQI